MSVIICESVKKFNVFRRSDKSNSNFPYRGGKRGVLLLCYIVISIVGAALESRPRTRRRHATARRVATEQTTYVDTHHQTARLRFDLINKPCMGNTLSTAMWYYSKLWQINVKKSWFNGKVVSWALDKRTYMVRWNITNKRIYHCRPFHWNLLSKQSW